MRTSVSRRSVSRTVRVDKFYVGQRIKLVEYDVDIVGTYTVRYHREALAPVASGYRMELPVAHLTLTLVEKRRYSIDTTGIADEYHLVGQLLGTEVQVKHRPIGMENKFGGRNLFHGGKY